ncbi:MAG: COG4315 family predicted lipoprotein [Nocardioidaceae bacterium]
MKIVIQHHEVPWTRVAKATGVAAAGLLLVAACGSSGSSGSPSTGGPTQTIQGGGGSPTGVAAVETHSGPLGTYLTDRKGMTLYIFAADKKGMSSCSGPCLTYWAPLTTKGMPTASGGAQSSLLGTIKSSNGATQVTYKGMPLYYYIADTKPGQTNGQGSNGFGAKWWVESPSGKPITSSASTPTSSPSSGGGNAWG